MLILSLKAYNSQPKRKLHPVPGNHSLIPIINPTKATSRTLIILSSRYGRNTVFYGMPKDVIGLIFQFGQCEEIPFHTIRIVADAVKPDFNYCIPNYVEGKANLAKFQALLGDQTPVLLAAQSGEPELLQFVLDNGGEMVD